MPACGFTFASDAFEATEADLHIAGTACVDYSLRGEQARDEGPSAPHTMCWLCQRATIQEAYFLHENVEQFNPSLLIDALGKWYDVDSTVVDCAEYAWPIARRRRYSIGRHKAKSLPFRHPANIFSCMFRRADLVQHSPDEPTWSCFFAATPEEIRDEMLWASRRPSSNFQEGTHCYNIHDPDMFLACLNDGEQGFLQKYLNNHNLFPGIAFSLNQDPSFGATHSTTTQLHTLIRNMGIIWILS